MNMRLILTIDTEEDNWANYCETDYTVANIERIVPLQRLFDRYGIKPTYLVTYPVVSNFNSMKILEKIAAKGSCEIGMHCHPWNTPPFNSKGVITDRDTMLCNLEEDLVHAKLASLHEKIKEEMGITPVSFRAGRYGFGPQVAASLVKLGYRIDTSLTPFVNWINYFGPDFSKFHPMPFRFSELGFEHKTKHGQLLEIPTTIGFLQNHFEAARLRLNALERPYIRKLHLAGLFERLGILNKVWLSPEMTKTSDMIKLSKNMKKMKYSYINMTFHSTSLRSGLSPFVKTATDERAFFLKIENFLKFVSAEGWESCTLSELEGSIGV